MDGGRDRGYSVVGEEEGVKAFKKGQISEGDDGIVSEIYGIVLVLEMDEVREWVNEYDGKGILL